MIKLNPVHKLALFYVERLKVGESLSQKFWQDAYGYNANDIIPTLLRKGIIEEGFDLNVSLSSMKVPELKTILKSNNLKVSGSKSQLIERIKENSNSIDFMELSRYYILSDEGKVIKHNSSHILYFHKNIHDIDIFTADNIYKNNHSVNSDEIIEEILIQRLEKDLKDENYSPSSYYAFQLAYYYGELNNEEKQIPQIIIGIVLEVLQEYKYAEMLNGLRDDENKGSKIIGYNTDLHTRLRAYFNKTNTNNSEMEKSVYEITYAINKDSTQADSIAKIVVAALNKEDDKVNTLFKKSSYIPQTDTNSINISNSSHKNIKADTSNSGCLIFIATPLISIIYTITNAIF